MKRTLYLLSGLSIGIAINNYNAIAYALFITLVTVLIDIFVEE